MAHSKEFSEARQLCQLAASLLGECVQDVSDRCADLQKQAELEDTSVKEGEQCKLYLDDAKFWMGGRDLYHYLSSKNH